MSLFDRNGNKKKTNGSKLKGKRKIQTLAQTTNLTEYRSQVSHNKTIIARNKKETKKTSQEQTKNQCNIAIQHKQH